MASLIIFIHGIGSDNDAWEDFIDVMESHVNTKNIVKYEAEITKIDKSSDYYIFYEYNSKINNIPIIQPLINMFKETFNGSYDEGKLTLKTHSESFQSFISTKLTKFDTINIVSHSMGGIISVKMLLNIIETKKSNIINKLDKVILYGTPLKGSSEPEKMKNIFGKNVPTNILNELKPKSKTITSLQQNLIKFKEELKNNFNILYIAGDKDSRIIEIKEKNIIDFGKFEKIQGGHSEIIRPENFSAESFIWFLNFIVENNINIALKECKSGENILQKDIEKLLNKYSEYIKIKSSHISTIVFNQVKIPLDEIYEPISLENKSAFDAINVDSVELDIDYNSNGKAYLIFDEAGMGKSTFSKHLTLQILKDTNKIPILFELSDFDNRITLKENIINKLNQLDISIDELVFNKLVIKGKFIIILDGFDELPRALQETLKKEIQDLNDKKGKSSILLTSRPQDIYPDLYDATTFKLKTLTKDQAISILNKYDKFASKKIGQNLIKEIEKVPVKFLETPLLVALLYKTYSFNGSIAKKISVFYSEIFHALYKGHDLTKSGYVREKQSDLDIDLFRELLRSFSFLYIIKSNTDKLSDDFFINLVDEAKSISSLTHVVSRNFLDDLISAVPLMTKDGNSLKFMHRTIAEFFAAEFIITRDDSLSFLNKILHGVSSQQLKKTIEFIYEINPNLYREAITKQTAQDFITKYKNSNLNVIQQMYLFLCDGALSYWKYDDVVENKKGTMRVNIPEDHEYSTLSFMYGTLNGERYVLALGSFSEKKYELRNSVLLDLSIELESNESLNYGRTDDADLNEISQYINESKWYKTNSTEVNNMTNITLIKELFARAINAFSSKGISNSVEVISLEKCENLLDTIRNLNNAQAKLNDLI